jgi:hypothetical protein
VNWYLEALKKYAQFKGRSQRKEYWWFITVDSVLSTLTAAWAPGHCATRKKRQNRPVSAAAAKIRPGSSLRKYTVA